MSAEITKGLLELDLEDGNVDGVLEHIADAHLTDKELKRTLANVIMRKAERESENALTVDCSWEQNGKGSFERRKASNLKELANQILGL